MKLRFFWGGLLLLAFSSPAWGQGSVEVRTLVPAERPPELPPLASVSVSSSAPSGSDVLPDDRSWQAKQLRANVLVPLLLFPHYKLIAGVSYRQMELSETSGTSTLDLHRIAVAFNNAVTLNKDWTLVLRLEPGLVSDFKDEVDAQAWQLGAQAMALVRLNEEWKLGFGGGISQNYLGYVPIPLLLVTYLPSGSRFGIHAALPGFVRFNMDLNPRWRVFSTTELDGSTWDVKLSENKLKDATLQQIEVRSGLGVRYEFTDGVQLQAVAGLSLWRRFTVNDVDNNQVFETSPDQAAFVRTSLAITPRVFDRLRKKR